LPEDKPTSRKRCSSCRTGGTYAADLQACPLCGSNFETEIAVADGSRVELLIPFAAAQCPVCGMVTLLRHDRQCAGCGATLDDEARSRVDEAVKRRRRAFKVRLERLTKRVQESGILQPSFTRTGQGVPLTEYVAHVFRSSLDDVTAITDTMRTEMRAVTWDPQEKSPCLTSFRQVVGALDRGITLVTTLANHLPPIEARAAHRLLTRTIGQLIHGYVTITTALIANDPDEALERQQAGQHLFTQAARTLGLLPRIITRASKQASPGWWMSGDTLDLAAIAWEGVENVPTTIDHAADVVRAALAMIPGIPELSDAEALLLLPATVFPVAVADPVLLQERAGLLRGVLDRADSTTPDWIQDPEELVLRINEGIRVVNEQVERLGFAATSPNSRRMTILLLADMYTKLVEGPLRDLGGVVVIAARAAGGEPNGRYIPAIARGVQAGDAVQELERMGPLWHEAVRMVVRNASAHGGVRVLDEGVALTQRRIENGVVVDEWTVDMRDAEFAEELARLSETCLALQLGIVPWLLTHQSEDIKRVRQAVSLTRQECEGIVRLLAGLQGLLHVEVERTGTTLSVQAQAAAGADAASVSIPASLVPAIFQSWSDVDVVTLHISSRDPVTYERTELPDVDPLSGTLDSVAVGLVGRRWLGNLTGDAAIVADITFLVRPQITVMIEAFRHTSTQPVSVVHVAEASTRLVALTTRLRSTQLPPPGTPLVAEVREAARDAVRRLDRLRWAFVGADIRERQRQTRSCAALVNHLGDIEQRAIAEFTQVEAAEKIKRLMPHQPGSSIGHAHL